MRERRKYERKPTAIKVELHHAAIGRMIGSTQDVSDGGALVSIENHPTPPVGTVLDVKFKKAVGHINEEPVPMRVMHIRGNAIGLMFVSR